MSATTSHTGRYKMHATNSAKKVENAAEREKPTFVLHIGPSKTATSTLQYDSQNFQESGILAKDGILFTGRHSGNISPLVGLFRKQCIKPWHDKSQLDSLLTNSSCAKPYQVLEESYRRNQSIIFSDEALSYINRKKDNCLYDPKNTGYLQFLNDEIFKKWDLQIMVGYRRHYEWSVSAMKQHWGTESLAVDSRWPHEGGKKCIQPLMLTWGKGKKKSTNNVRDGYRYIDQTIPALRRGGLDPYIWNFHGDRHITTALFCDVMKNAPNTCNYTQSRSILPQFNKREVGLQFYDNIVFHAAELNLKGFNVMNQTRNEAAINMMEYHQGFLNKSVHDLPMHRCPSTDKLKIFLNRTLKVEEIFIPDVYNSPQGKDAIIANFWSLVNKTRVFCQIDTERLFNGISSYDKLLDRLN